MFSASKLVRDLHPYERAQLLEYCVRPYLIKLATELGYGAKFFAKFAPDTTQLVELCQKSIRYYVAEKIDGEETNRALTKELEERSQLIFDFMRKGTTNEMEGL